MGKIEIALWTCGFVVGDGRLCIPIQRLTAYHFKLRMNGRMRDTAVCKTDSKYSAIWLLVENVDYQRTGRSYPTFITTPLEMSRALNLDISPER